MADTENKLTTGFDKEKIKWIFVAILSVALLGVVYKNWKAFRGSPGKAPVPVLRAETVGVDDLQEVIRGIQGLKPASLQPVDDEPDTAFTLLKRDLFALAATDTFSENDREDETRLRQAGQKPIILKGTILNGSHSVAFINDAAIGLGESFKGWQVARIGEDIAFLKKGQRDLTITVEGEANGTD
jgi:hypothetical protein